MDRITERFDKRTKLRVKDDKEAQFIDVGSVNDNDAKLRVRLGQLKVSG